MVGIGHIYMIDLNVRIFRLKSCNNLVNCRPLSRIPGLEIDGNRLSGFFPSGLRIFGIVRFLYRFRAPRISGFSRTRSAAAGQQGHCQKNRHPDTYCFSLHNESLHNTYTFLVNKDII